jgi:uncharacterized membrane protein (DUF2068 family)
MKKKEGFLKLIIFYKTCMGIGEFIVAVSLLGYLDESLALVLTRAALWLNLSMDSLVVVWVIRQAETLGENFVLGTVVALSIFSALNLVEVFGLHLRRRWAEWMTVIGTGVLIPYELYLMVSSFSVPKLLVLIINSLIVYYLAKHRELFGRKGERTVVSCDEPVVGGIQQDKNLDLGPEK